jgi:cation/acetate symporter
LLVLSTAVSPDIYTKGINPRASYGWRFLISRVMILIGVMLAAIAALPRLAFISQLVAGAFSLAASSFFSLSLLGIFWKRADAKGAIAGMLGGMVVCLISIFGNSVNPYSTVFGLSHSRPGSSG